MVTINGRDYAQSAKATFLRDHETDRLTDMLADERDSFNLRAEKLAGFRDPVAISAAIVKIRAGWSPANSFLPALHAHQLALWFEGRW